MLPARFSAQVRGSGVPGNARWIRALAWIAASLVLAACAYAGLANLVMLPRLHAAAQERGVELRYQSGYSLLPGRFHFLDVELSTRSSDGPEVWFEQVDCEIRLAALFRRTLHVETIDGRGLKLRLAGYDLAGGASLEAEGVEMDGDALSIAHGVVGVSQGSLSKDGRTLAQSLSGRVSVRGVGIVLGRQDRLTTVEAVHVVVQLKPAALVVSEHTKLRAGAGLSVTIEKNQSAVYPVRLTFEIPELAYGSSTGKLQGTVSLRGFPLSIDSPFVHGGQLFLDGAPAEPLLDLLGVNRAASSVVPRIADQPFTLDAKLFSARSWRGLEDIGFRSGETLLRGALYWQNETIKGALLLTFRQLRLGVELDSYLANAEFGASEDWLARRLVAIAP